MEALTDYFKLTKISPEEGFEPKINGALVGEDRLLLLKDTELSESVTRYVNFGPVTAVGPMLVDMNAEIARLMTLSTPTYIDLPNSQILELTDEELNDLVSREKLSRFLTNNPVGGLKKIAERNQAIQDLLDTQPVKQFAVSLRSALDAARGAIQSASEDRIPRRTESVQPAASGGGSVASGAHHTSDDGGDSRITTDDAAVARIMKRKRSLIMSQQKVAQRTAKESHLKTGVNLAGLDLNVGDALPMGAVVNGTLRYLELPPFSTCLLIRDSLSFMSLSSQKTHSFRTAQPCMTVTFECGSIATGYGHKTSIPLRDSDLRVWFDSHRLRA